MDKFSFNVHKRLDGDFVLRLRECFDFCLLEGRTKAFREGDERIFGFERFIAKPDAKFLFQRHLEYCDSINIKRPRYMTKIAEKEAIRSSVGGGSSFAGTSGPAPCDLPQVSAACGCGN